MQKRKIVGLKGGEPILFPFASLWEWEREDRKVPCETIALPGALTDRGLTILSHQKGLERLIVPDATHLFVSLSALRRFQATGVQVEVLRPTSIAAVAVNPVSPDGYSFPPDEMKARIQAICPTVPVWDAIRDHPGEGGCFDVLG